MSGNTSKGGSDSRGTSRPDKEQEKDVETLSTDEAIKSIINQNVQKDVLPTNPEVWEDPKKPGNCRMKIDDNKEFVIGGDIISGKELKERFGIEGITYRGNEPDFYPFVDKTLGVVDVSHMPTNRDGVGGTYDIAIQTVKERSGGRFKTKADVKRYMAENKLTWHETADRKHILPIPTSINSAFPHTGGISKQKSFEAMSEVIGEKYGDKIKLVRESHVGEVSGTIGGIIPDYAQRKKTKGKRKK